jgi:hypothetical protein
MKDELVRTARIVAFSSIAWGLSGCNGCNGCEGQTLEPSAPVARQAETAAIPSSVANTPIPSAMSVNSNPEHDPTGVRRCCKAISENLESAPDKHKATWKSALDICNQATQKQTGRKGLEPVRDVLTPVGWPGACQ